jgi:hypothetical protein
MGGGSSIDGIVNRGTTVLGYAGIVLEISCEISGSNSGEYEDGRLLGCCAIGKLLPDYTAQQPRSQSSSSCVL